MRSAVYYPHTNIRSQSLLKTALLLWDEIKVIVPWRGYHLEHSSSLEADAFHLVGRKLNPTEAEKRQLHEFVEDFASRELPRQFYLQMARGDERDYEMFANKLLPETWDMLKRAGMAHPARFRPSHTVATEPTALALMSILAACCAGSTFARVTDRSTAYASLAGLLSDSSDNVRQQSGEMFLTSSQRLIHDRSCCRWQLKL